MKKWWLCLLIVIVNCMVVSTQSIDFREFPEVKQDYRELQALQERLEFVLDSFEDISYVQDKASEVQLMKLELRELEQALNRPDENIIKFLDERFKYLRDSLKPPQGEDGAMEWFNLTYGHPSISYAFGGYFFEDDYYFADGVAIYVSEPLLNTENITGQGKPRSFEDLMGRRKKLNFVSSLKMANDSLIYDGRIFIRTGALRGDPKDERYIYMAEALAAESEFKVYSYTDTTTYYELELRKQENLVDQVTKSIETDRRTYQQLENYLNQLNDNPERYESIKASLVDIWPLVASAANAGELKAVIMEGMEELHSRQGANEEKLSELAVVIEELKLDAFLEAKDNAESFFAKSWERHYAVLDGQIVMENTGGRPYVRLMNWSIRIEN